MPAARPHLAAATQRVVETMLAPRPVRLFTTFDMLARYPPARHFTRALRISNIVDDQDVADKAHHLGRDIGVALVHIETMHPDAAGLLMHDLARVRRIGHVVDLET